MTTAPPAFVSADRSPDDHASGVRVAAPGAWLVLIGGVVGLVASAILTVEKIRLLADPGYVPPCNLNPVLSCGSVMATEQASVLGFPNSLIGISAFTVVTVAGLLSVTKVPLPQWFWVGLTVGTLAGAVFVHWLIFDSLYRIGALCPYCMVVWTVTIPLLVVLVSVTFQPTDGPGRMLYQWRWSITALWFVAVVLLIFLRFQDYWSTIL